MTSLFRIPRLLRYAGYALIALLTFEICARTEDLVLHGASFWRPYTIESVFMAGPEGRLGRPNASFGKWSMNSFGYRGPEPSAGVPRVLAFGASETFGLYESPGREYPRQLESALRAQGFGPVEVVNVALPGMRVGHAGHLRRAIETLRPQWVLIYPSPANYIGAERRLCVDPAQAPASGDAAAHGQAGPAPLRPLHLRLAGKVEQVVKPLMPLSWTVAVKRLAIRRAEREAEPMARLPQPMLDLFLADVDCTVRTAQALGARVVLATHATRFGPDLQPGDGLMLTNWRSFYPELREEGFLDMERRANQGVRELAARRGLPLVDAAAVVPGGPEHFADFVHFTDEGARRMAALAAQAFVRGVSDDIRLADTPCAGGCAPTGAGAALKAPR